MAKKTMRKGKGGAKVVKGKGGRKSAKRGNIRYEATGYRAMFVQSQLVIWKGTSEHDAIKEAIVGGDKEKKSGAGLDSSSAQENRLEANAEGGFPRRG